MNGYDYWIDYCFGDGQHFTRRWIETYAAFQADLDDLVCTRRSPGVRVIAFGYQTTPPPLAHPTNGRHRRHAPRKESS